MRCKQSRRYRRYSKVERIAVGFNAAILAVQGDEPVVAVVAERREERNSGDGALPCGLFSPTSARWQPGDGAALLRAGHRPASSSGPPGRSARSARPSHPTAQRKRPTSPVVAVSYLALVDPSRINDRDGASWRSWYAYFPWEDWRRGKPGVPDGDHRAPPRGLGAARRRRQRHARDGPRPAPAHRLRLRRRRLGRGEGARALRASERGRPARRVAAMARSPVPIPCLRGRCRGCGTRCSAISARCSPAPSASCGARQVPAGGVRADARACSRCSSCRRRSRRSWDRICTSRISAAWWRPAGWSSRPASTACAPAAGRPSSTASAATCCWSGPPPACGSRPDGLTLFVIPGLVPGIQLSAGSAAEPVDPGDKRRDDRSNLSRLLEFATVAPLIKPGCIAAWIGECHGQDRSYLGRGRHRLGDHRRLVASAKRRDHSFWAAWSFLVPPMLLILLVMPSHKGPRPRRPGIDEIEDRQAF